jgi:uracil-DNA glycosylase family 4
MSPFIPKTERPGVGMRVTLKRVPGEGSVPARVMLIGERPGLHEAEAGRPFVGVSGQILDRCLTNAGLSRKEIYVTNLVKDYQEYDKPTSEEVLRDEEELRAEILCVDPDVIGTLGTFATEWVLTESRAGLDKHHGVPTWIGPDNKHARRRLVVPCYHPAAGLYSSNNLALTGSDIISVAMAAEGRLLPPVDEFGGELDYALDPNPEIGAIGECGVDTEGSYRRPWCLTWSIRPGHARLVLPGHSPQFHRRIWLWNSLHDLPVMRAMGIRVDDEQFIDLMVQQYLLCIEPQGLKESSYRNLGMVMDSYPDIIAEADYAKAMEYLLEVEARAEEWSIAEPYVLIEGGIAKVKKPQSVARRVANILRDVRTGKTNKQGEPTDPRYRWNQVDDVIKRPVVETIGEMPEATLDDVPFEDALKYACRDADATLRNAPIVEAKIDEMGLRRVSEIDHAIIPMIDRMQEVGIKLADKVEWDTLERTCDEQMGRSKFGIYTATGADINPDSGDQVAELLYTQLAITPPKMTKGGDRGSTIDKALETIRTHRDIIDLVLDYREASKVISSFINPLRKLSQVGDGRVRCNFRITRVSSGRLAATNPNLLAIPVRSDLGKCIRERFIASDGKTLGEWDLDQVEMRYMADESGDPLLCTIFNEGKVDIHRQTAAWTFGVPYDQVVTEQRYAAKRVGFGVITGITGHGLVDQMNLARARRPDGQPWTEADCDTMIDEWFKIYKRVKSYMDRCKEETYATGVSRDRWGRIRYLPGIWSPLPWVADEAGRQSHSHKIQAGAQGLMKQAMAWIWKNVCKVTPEVEPLLQVHDSLMLEVPDREDVKEFVSDMTVFGLTNTTKLCVPLKAKGSYGKSWAECKD